MIDILDSVIRAIGFTVVILTVSFAAWFIVYSVIHYFKGIAEKLDLINENLGLLVSEIQPPEFLCDDEEEDECK